MKSIFLKETTAVVKSYNDADGMYELQIADGTLFRVPKNILHFGSVQFPAALLEHDGTLKAGKTIKVQIRQDRNCVDRLFVNAAQCYWDAPTFHTNTTSQQVGKKKYVESLNVELKSSFLHTAMGKKQDETLKVSTKQSIVIAREASAMSNARVAGKIIVGVDDQSRIVGVEDEVDDTVKFQSVLRNDIAVCTSWAFAESLTFGWVTEEGHLICIIDIPVFPRIVLVKGCEVWKRVDTDCVQLKGDHLIETIKNWVA